MKKIMLIGMFILFLLSIGVLAQTSGNQLVEGDMNTFTYCEKGDVKQNDVYINHKDTFALADKVGKTHLYQYMSADAQANENTKIKLKDLESGDSIILNYLYQSYAGGVKGAKLTVGLQQDYAGGVKEGKDYYLILEGNSDSQKMDARLMLYVDDFATQPISKEVCQNYEITLIFVGNDPVSNKLVAKFVVDGKQTPTLSMGESYTLTDGSVITVTDILYQTYAAGEHRVWFSINGVQGTEKVDSNSNTVETSPVSKSVDLSNYPELFVLGKQFNAYFVVGGNAPAIDNLAITDISDSFTKAGYIVINAAKLDSELNNPLHSNLIVIGKPTENDVTNLLFGGVTSSLKQGEGMIKLFENYGYVQMLVTGYSAEDTRKAAKVLQNYKDYSLSGTEVIVTGSMSNPQVKTSVSPIVVKPIVPNSQSESQSQPKVTPQAETSQNAECVSECPVNGNCLPYGTRLLKDGKSVYCNVDGTLQTQQGLNEGCQNNYECSSNQCGNAKCVDLQQLSGQLQETNNLLAKILAWIEKLFK